MAKLLKLRRGTTSQHSSFTGAEGEVTIDTTKDTAVVHDGSQAGGRPLAREDMANVSSGSIAGRLGTDSIATSKIAAGALPTDVTVASANIVDGTIVNGDVNASAAIAGTKISPNFGSQDITTTGKVLFANVYSTEGDLPSASTYHGMFAHVHGTGLAYYAHGGSWHKLAKLDAPDFTSGIDVQGTTNVTGTITATSTITTPKVTLNSTSPTIEFEESDGNPDYRIISESGALFFQDLDAGPATRIKINTDGHVDILGNLDCASGIDVTGNITVSGTVDGVDIAARNTLFGGLTSSSGALTNGVTATTQTAGDSTTKVATTAFVSTAVSNLIDSSPSTLNTLNELASALGDDPNFATTTATSLGTKLPKSGGQMTGNITFSGSQTVDGRDLSSDGSKLDGIESGATADQTAAEIRALVESASDSNVFTNADHSKLNGIESGATADQSASEILNLVKTVDGSGSGLDADTLDGLSPSVSAGNNTIVQRHSAGYIFANYFNTTPNDVSSGVTKVCVETGNDGYIRHGDASSIRSFINVENGATADQSGSEIASALNGQNIYTSGVIGRDSNDNISFSNNSYMNIHVNGNNRFRFESDGDLHADGDVIAYSTTTSSDERLKKDITRIEDAVEKCERLRGVTFTWKKDDKKSAGVIAQEVQKVLPEAVKTITDLTSDEEHLGVNYNALIPILLEAVKELNTRLVLLEEYK